MATNKEDELVRKMDEKLAKNKEKKALNLFSSMFKSSTEKPVEPLNQEKYCEFKIKQMFSSILEGFVPYAKISEGTNHFWEPNYGETQPIKTIRMDQNGEWSKELMTLIKNLDMKLPLDLLPFHDAIFFEDEVVENYEIVDPPRIKRWWDEDVIHKEFGYRPPDSSPVERKVDWYLNQVEKQKPSEK